MTYQLFFYSWDDFCCFIVTFKKCVLSIEMYPTVLILLNTCHVAAVPQCVSFPQQHLGQYDLCITGAVAEHKVESSLYCNRKRYV